MNTLKNPQESLLSARSTEIINQTKAVLADSHAQQLSVVGNKVKTMPILKLNFADPSSTVTIVNHASHSSHSSHASHHSRHH
jgi:hypothetical protein